MNKGPFLLICGVDNECYKTYIKNQYPYFFCMDHSTPQNRIVWILRQALNHSVPLTILKTDLVLFYSILNLEW
jgi:hypothetical protein